MSGPYGRPRLSGLLSLLIVHPDTPRRNTQCAKDLKNPGTSKAKLTTDRLKGWLVGRAVPGHYLAVTVGACGAAIQHGYTRSLWTVPSSPILRIV